MLKCISLLPVCTASHPFWSPLRECSGLNHSRNDPPSLSLHQSVKKQLLMIETRRPDWEVHHLATSAGSWSGSLSHSHLELLFSWMYIFLFKEDMHSIQNWIQNKDNCSLSFLCGAFTNLPSQDHYTQKHSKSWFSQCLVGVSAMWIFNRTFIMGFWSNRQINFHVRNKYGSRWLHCRPWTVKHDRMINQ